MLCCGTAENRFVSIGCNLATFPELFSESLDFNLLLRDTRGTVETATTALFSVDCILSIFSVIVSLSFSLSS